MWNSVDGSLSYLFNSARHGNYNTVTFTILAADCLLINLYVLFAKLGTSVFIKLPTTEKHLALADLTRNHLTL